MKKQLKQSSMYWLLPVALIVMIVPLIVHMKGVPVSSSAKAFWKTGDTDYDFFSYYKTVYFMGLTILAFVLLLYKYMKDHLKLKKTYFYIPMAIYSVLVVLSTIVSKEKDVSLVGFPNRYEGVFVLLGYMLIMFVIINLMEHERHVKLILGGLLFSSVVIGVIALFQYFNLDLFQTSFGKKLMLPAENWSIADQLNFQLGPRAAYGTLFHTNYVGSFAAMILPLSLFAFIYLEKVSYKIGTALVSILMFASLIASHSRAGIIGTVFSGVLVIILARKKLKQNMKYVAIFAVAMVFVVIGINSVTKGQILEKIGTLYNDSSRTVTEVAGVKDVVVNKNVVTLSDSKNNLTISYDNGNISAFDTQNKPLPVINDTKTNKLGFSDARYIGYTIMILNFQSQIVLEISKENFKIDLIATSNGFKLYDGRGNALDISEVERWGFKGNEELGSARGYIWSRSLPLLKRTFITGFGPDTFAIHFPQHDYLGKLLAYNDATIIVDKPHNIYIQTAINTGFVSLLALLALFIMYFVFSLKLLLSSDFGTFLEMSGAGVFVAVCGYLGSGFFNDSTVSVAPVFWVLMGLGIGINLIINEKRSVINGSIKTKVVKSN